LIYACRQTKKNRHTHRQTDGLITVLRSPTQSNCRPYNCGAILRFVSAVSDESPNSTTRTYSVLLEKMSSRERCVTTWKQRFVDPRPSDSPASSPVRTTTRNCVEQWEMPCGRPDFTAWTVTNTPGGAAADFSLNTSTIVPTIVNIRQTVRNITEDTVSRVLLDFIIFTHKMKVMSVCYT